MSNLAAHPVARPRGFSLIELMVALVVAMIVSAAVLAMVVAIIRSNRHTLQSTRLNQELRATLAMISNDLRRARSVDDPLSTDGNLYRAVNTATERCVVYAYHDAANGPWHVVTLESGQVVLHGTPSPPDSCSPDDPATVTAVLGSDQVEITNLDFAPDPPGTDETLVRQLTVTIDGHRVDGDPAESGPTKTMAQTVYVRSVGAGN